MHGLIIVGCKGEETANSVLSKLAALQKECLIDLRGAYAVVCDQSRQAYPGQDLNLVGMGAATHNA